MQDLMAVLRDRQAATASQPPTTVAEARATFAPAGPVHPVPDDVRVSEVSAAGVPAHWLEAPEADSDRVLLFLHGGGYELGSLRSDGELAARLGRASGMRVLFPEYRLAPEHPFPAAIDDVRAFWQWLRTDQRLRAGSMAVASDSVGGALAVALLVATRDAGDALPAAAVLMSPTVDLTSSGASMTDRADEDPADVLLSDSERLAEAAAEAGVDVHLEVGEGLPHVDQLALRTEAAMATERVGKFLQANVP